MKSFRSAVAAMALFWLAAASANAQEPEPAVEWLMVVQGQIAETSTGELRLNAAPSAIVFSDRPERRVGLVDLADFSAAAWAEGGTFATDPPNASLIDEASGAISIITITDMAYEAGVLTLGIMVLAGTIPEVEAHIALTIDAFPTSVNGQITDSVTQANTKVLGEAPAEAMGNLFEGE